MNQFYRAMYLALFCCLSWTVTAETPPIEADFFTTCADRTVINTDHCTEIGVNYGFYLNHGSLEKRYTFSNGEFREFFDGTATLTGRITNNDDSRIAFDVDITLTGRTTVSPTGPCLLYTSPSPRDATLSRMPSSA